MNGMAVVIAAALLLGLGGLGVLLWALSSDQYEDLEGDALRILNDDPPPPR
jgi:cbb3-type cytochrome oxidase maturation protein